MFRFKKFSIDDSRTPMKVGTDGVLLGAWADTRGADRIIDLGTGSGLIALMMAQRTDDIPIVGIEIASGAAADARANAAASPWHDRITITEADCISYPFPSDGRTMLISNPPFFEEALRSPDSGRALARHGGEFDVMTLIDIAGRLPDPMLAFIAPASRDDEIEFRLALRRLNPVRICSVITRGGRPAQRTLWQAARQGRTERTSLIMRDAANRYTPEYLRLTSDFYLDR